VISADIVWLRDDPAVTLDDFVFSPDTMEHACIHSPERRRSFILSRALLRHVLAPRLGVAKNTIRFSRTDSGRLVLATDSPCHFSLSHSAGLVAVVIANAECGVDIEASRPVAIERIAKRYFSDAENAWLAQADCTTRARDFFRLWTLKEAAVKALHEGLANNLARLAFDVSAEPARLIDPSPGLQVYQKIEGDIFMAAAIKTGEEVAWNVSQTNIGTL